MESVVMNMVSIDRSVEERKRGRRGEEMLKRLRLLKREEMRCRSDSSRHYPLFTDQKKKFGPISAQFGLTWINEHTLLDDLICRRGGSS